MYISELEQVFGYKPGYTGLTGLCKTDRQGIVARSFSVLTIVEILKGLQEYYFITN